MDLKQDQCLHIGKLGNILPKVSGTIYMYIWDMHIDMYLFVYTICIVLCVLYMYIYLYETSYYYTFKTSS